MAYGNLVVFWMAFAGFIGPVFVISLICSIVKAVRDRHRFYKRRAEEKVSANGNGDVPVDAEIITSLNGRKPKIEFIEDEARKKQFRSSGHSSNGAPPPHKANSSTHNPETTSAVIEAHEQNADNRPSTTFDRCGNENEIDSPCIPNGEHNNGTCVRTTTHSVNSNRLSHNNNVKSKAPNGVGSRHSVDNFSDHGVTTAPSQCSHTSVDPPPPHFDLRLGSDIDDLRYRRHSTTNNNSSWSPEFELEPMNSGRSKSEVNLFNGHSNSNGHSNTPPSYLETPSCQGRDNEGFSKSMETTIMF